MVIPAGTVRAQRPGKEAPGGRMARRRGQQDVDDLAMLVDRPVQVGPLAGGLHVRLIDEPPVTRSVAAWPGRLDELRGEALDPSVDGDGSTVTMRSTSSSSTSRWDRPYRRYQRTATEMTSGGNRKPAKDETEPDAVTSPVSRSPRSTNATVPVWLIQSLLPARFQQPAPGREDQARCGMPRLALQLSRLASRAARCPRPGQVRASASSR